MRTIHRGIPGSKWLLFELSSHMPHAEKRKSFMAELASFLERTEAGTRNE